MLVVDAARRRLDGTHQVDAWGLEPDLVGLFDPLVRLRWSIHVEGADGLPATGPAVVVANRRLWVSEPFVLAAGLRRATGRVPRILGVPDVAPVGPLLRRLGGALDRPQELASLLRAGELAVTRLSPSVRSRRRAGSLRPAAIAPALDLDVPVVPAAVTGRELGRAWRVVLGPPVPPSARGVEATAEAVRRAVQALLDGDHGITERRDDAGSSPG